LGAMVGENCWAGVAPPPSKQGKEATNLDTRLTAGTIAGL
jgi:hypothetical protein